LPPGPERWRASWLAQRIERSGRAWRYDEVVAALLYDHERGFYASGQGRAGRQGGDFLTSPEVGPLFGAVLARVLDRWWEEAGRPRPFVVAEAGAGPGTLARAVVAAAPECLQAGALDYVAVEIAPAQRARHPGTVRSAPRLPPRSHVVVANELLDNLPFRLAACTGRADVAGAAASSSPAVPAAWREVLVGPSGEEPGAELRDERLPRFVSSPDARVPLQHAARDWLAEARRRAERVVVVDYGAATRQLAERPWRGWVRTYRRHERGGHPLDDPGEQDVTCDVAFDQLPAPDWHATQAGALRTWGIDALVEEGRRAWAEGAARGDLAALAGRSRVREAEALTDPHGLGAFHVLHWSGVDARPLPG
jgi:SAM-dependent MidA family methyltransferase